MGSLKVRFSQSAERRGVFAYALKVDVVCATDMPSKIFVYHQAPIGADGNTSSEFVHIATPVDFHEIPEDSATVTIPWYRTDSCTVWLRSIDDLRTAKQLFVDDIKALQRNYDLLTSKDDFTNQTTLEFSNGEVKNVE